MMVTIQNQVYPQACEAGAITAEELVLAAEQLQDCIVDKTVQSTSVRRGKARRVIDGLLESGVRAAAIPPWLLVIMALVELMPDVIDIIQRIIDAINVGKPPAELLTATRS